jgi:TonB family protein
MDLPPGPEQEEQQASVPTPQQKEEAKPTNLPQDTPTETPDPDRIVSRTKSDKPTEDDPKVETQKMMPQPDQDAQVATAPQTLDSARESDTTTAPNIGLGKDKQKLTADWGRKVSAYFEMHKRFPESAHKSANVKVALVFNRLGHVLSAAVEESSGDPLYDEAALSMIRRSDPVPRPPAKLTDDEFSFTLEVRFNGSKK